MSKIGTFDQNFVGLDIYPKGSSVNVRTSVGTEYPILVTVQGGNLVGKTTGAYAAMSDGKWIQTKIGDKFGYVRSDVVNLVKPQTVTKKDAFGIIQKLVESDKQVFETLLRIGPLLTAVKQKGINTQSSEKINTDLWTRLQKRQDDIKKSNLVKWEAGIKKAYQNLQKYAVEANTYPGAFLMGISGAYDKIGALPAIIIGVVAGVGLAAGAYFIFKPKYDESGADLKISKDLENLLAKIDPATAKKITDDLNKQIDDAYNAGKTDQWLSSLKNILLPLGIGLGGYFLITSFVRKESNKNKK